MANFIFLDVDGVLNSKHFGEKCNKNCCHVNWWANGLLDQECLLLLQRLYFTLPNTHIVVCSSWRDSSHHTSLLNLQLSLYGISIYGATNTNSKLGRGAQIMEWVSSHANCDNFVVLDDDNDIRDYPPETEVSKHLVWISYCTGLRPVDVDKAIKILKGE